MYMHFVEMMWWCDNMMIIIDGISGTLKPLYKKSTFISYKGTCTCTLYVFRMNCKRSLCIGHIFTSMHPSMQTVLQTVPNDLSFTWTAGNGVLWWSQLNIFTVNTYEYRTLSTLFGIHGDTWPSWGGNTWIHVYIYQTAAWTNWTMEDGRAQVNTYTVYCSSMCIM